LRVRLNVLEAQVDDGSKPFYYDPSSDFHKDWLVIGALPEDHPQVIAGTVALATS
jgi:hypothetical protein